MNVLLTIGILLQIYSIYRTPTHSANIGQGAPNFQRGLRKSFFHPPPSNELRADYAYPVYNYDRSPVDNEEFQAGTAIQNNAEGDEHQLQENQWSEEQMRKNRNWILYGNENGPVQKINNDVPPPWDDDEFDENKAENATKGSEDAPFMYSKYNYSLPAQRNNWTLPTQPNPTNESNIAVIILSERSNFERRQTIRDTWGKGHKNCYFIIGGPEPHNQEDKNWSNLNSTSVRLFQEQERYGDILDTVHPDTYKGLPYKLHFAIQWISDHPGMKHIQWVLKVDDDVVVRINALQYYSLLNINPARPIVIGRIDPDSTPHRTGKWAEDPKWEGIDGVDVYPPWAYGSTGYVMSRPVVDYVASQKSIYYYQGEDVSLGIWLYESPLDVSWFDSPDFNLENQMWADHTTSAVIGHNLMIKEMQIIFEKWQDPKVLSKAFHKNHTKVKGIIYFHEQKKEQHKEYDEFAEYEDGHYMQWDTEQSGEESDFQYIVAEE